MTDHAFASEIWAALGGDAQSLEALSFSGAGALPSVFPVTDLAVAAVGVAGLALAEMIAAGSPSLPRVTADRRLASFWFGTSVRPQGWAVPPAWDGVAGDYQAADGWIRLHTNAPAHRAAALSVLGVPAEKPRVAAAVVTWEVDRLEAAVLAAGGCAATMRSAADWAAHPQGQAVAAEPLLHRAVLGQGSPPDWPVRSTRPLAGIRVLDLTRVLAGPTATRCLAGYGAHVLRIDPPFWDEPALAPEMTLGKACARLDLRCPEDLATLQRLIAEADVLIHGYRPGALAGFGLDAAGRRALNPTLVDVALDAYGWTGPWQARRGFDSLVQMSTGIADAGMRGFQRDRPTPLPVQALDMATGYVMAAAALRGLSLRRSTGQGMEARASLARMATLLMSPHPFKAASPAPLAPETPADWDETVEETAWGPAQRLRAPVLVEGCAMRWDRAAGPLGAAGAVADQAW
jgi:crotonobetainyl-CoA:carnitine CoA-transferase CaiB-like acyl-CoA transferase